MPVAKCLLNGIPKPETRSPKSNFGAQAWMPSHRRKSPGIPSPQIGFATNPALMERYMGLPSENVTGCDLTSPVLAAENIHGRVLMLHSEVDDNVHLANTMQMATALQKAGKLFDMMVYPGAAHAVHEPSQDYHLMLTSLAFLRRELLTKGSGP